MICSSDAIRAEEAASEERKKRMFWREKEASGKDSSDEKAHPPTRTDDFFLLVLVPFCLFLLFSLELKPSCHFSCMKLHLASIRRGAIQSRLVSSVLSERVGESKTQQEEWTALRSGQISALCPR